MFRVAEALRCAPTLGFAPVTEALADERALVVEAAAPVAMDSFGEIDESLRSPSRRDRLREQLARALVNKGEALAAAGYTHEAIDTYDKAIGGFHSAIDSIDEAEHEAKALARQRAMRLAED